MALRPSVLLALVLLVVGCVAPGQRPGSGAHAPSAGGGALDCGHAVVPPHDLSAPAGADANASWKQDCLMRGSTTPRTKAETWLAINPTNAKNIVIGAKDMNPDSSAKCVWNGLAVTHDAGASWKDVTIGGKYADRRPGSPFFGYACNTDAMFAFTKDGALHFGVEMYNLGGSDANGPIGSNGGLTMFGWHILLATSHDGGDSWPDVIDFQPESGTTTDYSRMTVSAKTDTILEAINNIATGITCHVLSSRDGGKTAAPPVKVTPQGAPGSSICRAIAVNPKSGVVVVAFKGPAIVSPTGEPEDRSWLVRSTDDGRTFVDSNEGFGYHEFKDPFPNMNASSRAGQQFEAKYDASGSLWAITAEAPHDDPNVYVRKSKDDGRTWSEPVQVNDAARQGEQWMPQIAFGGDGTAHAFFFDRGYADGHLVDVTHAWSSDAGATWSSERVTTKSWDPDLGRHQEGAPWIGDYIGADALGADVWVGVPDTSLGGEPVIAAAHVHKG